MRRQSDLPIRRGHCLTVKIGPPSWTVIKNRWLGGQAPPFTAAQSAVAADPASAGAGGRRPGLRAIVQDRTRHSYFEVLIQGYERCSILGHHQPRTLRPTGTGVFRHRTPGSPGRSLGPSHPPRPQPEAMDELQVTRPQTQPGQRWVPSSRRFRRRIDRAVNVVSYYSCNVATLPDLLPSVIMSVVHDSAAPVAQFLGAIDNRTAKTAQQGTQGAYETSI